MAQRTQPFMTPGTNFQIPAQRRDTLATTAQQVNQVVQQVQWSDPSHLSVNWDHRSSFSISGEGLEQQIRALSLNPTNEGIEALMKEIISIVEQMTSMAQVRSKKPVFMSGPMDYGLRVVAGAAKRIPVRTHSFLKEKAKAYLLDLAARLDGQQASDSQQAPERYQRLADHIDSHLQW